MANNKDALLFKSSSSAEFKNAKINEERSFFANLIEATLQGKFEKVQSMCDEYAIQHSISVYDVLTEFKDGRGRTTLHFACQSTPEGDESENTKEEDIVYQLLFSEWAKQHKVLETDTAATTSQHSILRCKDTDGITHLMVSCQLAEKDPKLSDRRVQILLQAGENKLALARSKDGATALHYAAGAGAAKDTICRLYDAAKAAVHVNSKRGGTPLHWCVCCSIGEGAFLCIQLHLCELNLHCLTSASY